MTSRKWFCFEFQKIFDILDFGFNSSVPPPPLPVAPLRPKEIFIQRIHNLHFCESFKVLLLGLLLYLLVVTSIYFT